MFDTPVSDIVSKQVLLTVSNKPYGIATTREIEKKITRSTEEVFNILVPDV